MTVHPQLTRETLDQWYGDTELLEGFEEELAYDNDLCEQVFYCKQEAFSSGLRLGRWQKELEADPDARVKRGIKSESDRREMLAWLDGLQARPWVVTRLESGYEHLLEVGFRCRSRLDGYRSRREEGMRRAR